MHAIACDRSYWRGIHILYSVCLLNRNTSYNLGHACIGCFALVKIIRINDPQPMRFLMLDKFKILTVHWKGHFDEREKIIYIAPEANWKTIIHELMHFLITKIPLKKIREISDSILDRKFRQALKFSSLPISIS